MIAEPIPINARPSSITVRPNGAWSRSNDGGQHHVDGETEHSHGRHRQGEQGDAIGPVDLVNRPEQSGHHGGDDDPPGELVNTNRASSGEVGNGPDRRSDTDNDNRLRDTVCHGLLIKGRQQRIGQCASSRQRRRFAVTGQGDTHDFTDGDESRERERDAHIEEPLHR